MNKKRMVRFCFLSCQFEIRNVCGIAMCHSKKRDLGCRRNKLYYFEIYIVYLHFCKSILRNLSIYILY